MRFRLEPYLFRCDGCNKEWKMDDAQINLSYWCPYCGTEQHPIGLFGQVAHSPNQKSEFINPQPQAEQLLNSYAMDGERPTPEPEKKPPSLMTKKQPKRMFAEDKMTEKMCKEGGWWNPIKKECQGEGNGHDVGGATWGSPTEDME